MCECVSLKLQENTFLIYETYLNITLQKRVKYITKKTPSSFKMSIR